jgi:hypothetical protein
MAEHGKEPLAHVGGQVMVSMEDATLIRKVHKILDSGKNVEIRNDKDGKPKVLKVSKEIA